MKTNILTLLLCVCCITAHTQVAFQQQVVIDSTYGAINPRGVATADIDNDGFTDLLVVGYGDAVWIRNTDGAGNFENRQPLLTGFVETEIAAAADFDGDGDNDVLIYARADNSSYEMLYLENMDGLGTFAEPVSLTETAYTIHLNLQVLDMDNDGDMDIAYSSSENISWLENTDGQATFEDHYLLGDNEGFYAVDVDGDDIADVIGDFGYDLRAYKLNADGSLSFFETMNTFSLNNDHKAADIDGDGDNDVVTFFENGNTRQVHWYENTDGLGFFNNRQVLLDLPTISTSSSNDRKGLELIDIDNDDLLDIVTFESRREGLSWYKNLGSGLFGEEQIISEQIPNLTSIAIADLDNDGAQDIAFTDYILNEYSWFKNQDGLGDFGSKKRISSYAYSVNHVDYGDMDGDGDLDLISSSHGDNKIAWYENTSSQGHFLDIQQLVSTTAEKARDAFAVDMDGDTDLDILAFTHLDATTDEYQLLWFENDGTGNFIAEHVFGSTEDIVLRINYADIDNDGDIDVICGQENSVLTLYKNNGDGTFETAVVFSEPGFAWLLSLQVADIDGDDDIDVLASYNGNEIIWHENDGLGDLSTKHVIIAEMHYPNSVYATDIDGDGDNDVLFANLFRDEVGYFLNEDGQGTFGDSVIVSEIPQDPHVIYSLDVDDDGDMDMVAHSMEGQKLTWFPNNGDATFEAPIEITSLIGRISHITSADINGDGRTDLLTSSYEDDQVAWFENLGVLFTNTISGVVRLDANADDCDATDAGIPNLLIQSENSTNSFATFTQSDGSYSIPANQDVFTTSISSALPVYYESSPASHSVDFADTDNSLSAADFCVEANEAINDLEVVVYPDQDDPRPGFETSYRLLIKNKGTVPLSGTIDFQYDDAKLSLLSASETVSTQTSNTLTFNYSDLLPFETRYIDLEFTVFPPPTVNSDDLLESIATIYPLSGDVSAADNSFPLSQLVVNAYDPNDIRVLEGETITLEEADDYLHYIIRFQNTGTANAINIRVNNVLDNQLDWSSLQLESLSHPGRAEITDGNHIDFIFENINLPDSTANEPASHGFIAYKIKPKADVVIGDVFSNTAAIFFDFNPPIITNTVMTEIVNLVYSTDIVTSSLQLYPNPAGRILNIESATIMNSIQIYELNGRLLSSFTPHSKTFSLDATTLMKGFYFIAIQSTDGLQVLKFVKE